MSPRTWPAVAVHWQGSTRRTMSASLGHAVTELCPCTAAGKDSAPARTIATRIRDPKAFQTPAPGTYEPKEEDDSPRYSFGLRPNLEKPNNVPGESAAPSHSPPPAVISRRRKMAPP